MYVSRHPCLVHTDNLFILFAVYSHTCMQPFFCYNCFVMFIVECWMEHPVRSLDKTFTYLSDFPVEVGARVLVPFGHKEIIGFVESIKEDNRSIDELSLAFGYELKKIISVLDEESLITKELHDLALWMSEETISTRIACFQAMLPSIIKPSSHHKKAVKEKWIELSHKEESLTPKQLEAYQYILNHSPLRYVELRKQFPNQAKQLVDKGVILLVEKEREADEIVSSHQETIHPLTPLQTKVIEEIEQTNDAVYLLRGVTGSGKTEIYLQLARKAIDQGKQVLILVPEISLTPQMIERVSSRFTTGLAIYHSGLNAQEKYEQYRRVKTGKATIIVGTRSSVFLPFSHLGLIVMDEEHDHSYKQDKNPAYHARDIAIKRGEYHQCKVLLGSATPSLESYARALRKVYHLVEMKQRINDTLPKITLVPMKDELKKGGSLILSSLLKEKIKERLEKDQQIILLLNRRGFSTQLRCKNCEEILKCPHCDLALRYHRSVSRLICHACGTELSVPKYCPNCKSESGYMNTGFGTERLEDEVRLAFPEARILRMDADTTKRKNSHMKILKSFGDGEADILVGTQMIAKGLDYPKVTLVGVINGDEGIQRTDYRSCEITFDLLMQAGGRSGRAKEVGEVIYQVFDPDHYAIKAATIQDYDYFFNQEMVFRRAGQYPPYTYMISLLLVGRDKEKVEENAIALKDALQGNFKVIGIIQLLKIADLYRYRIILKGKDLKEMRSAIKNVIADGKIDVKGLRIDVNPLVLD